MVCLKVRLLLPGSAEVPKSAEDLLRQAISAGQQITVCS